MDPAARRVCAFLWLVRGRGYGTVACSRRATCAARGLTLFSSALGVRNALPNVKNTPVSDVLDKASTVDTLCWRVGVSNEIVYKAAYKTGVCGLLLIAIEGIQTIIGITRRDEYVDLGTVPNHRATALRSAVVVSATWLYSLNLARQAKTPRPSARSTGSMVSPCQ